VSSFRSAAPTPSAPPSSPPSTAWTPDGAAPAPAGDAWPRTATPAPEPVEHPRDEPAAPPWATSRPAPGTALDEDDDYDEDDEPSRRLHPYTWLHVLVLAVVAFVLGFLIMLLVIQTRPDPGAGETAAALIGWVSGRAGPL